MIKKAKPGRLLALQKRQQDALKSNTKK